MRFDVYTDGSFRKRYGRGMGAGWVVVDFAAEILVLGSKKLEARGSNAHIAELLAVREALRTLPPNSHATIYSDCQIVIDWVSGSRTPPARPAYVSIFQEVEAAIAMHADVRFNYIAGRGHSGCIWNEVADKLAYSELPPYTKMKKCPRPNDTLVPG